MKREKKNIFIFLNIYIVKLYYNDSLHIQATNKMVLLPYYQVSLIRFLKCKKAEPDLFILIEIRDIAALYGYIIFKQMNK
jgi:hypothetical protein